MMRKLLNRICIAAAMLAPIASHAATLTLKDGATDTTFYPGGYAGTEDSSIYYYAAPSGDARYPNAWMRGASGGINSFLYTSNLSTNYRVLLRFNLGDMATTAASMGKQVVVTSDATIHLRTYDTQAAARSLSLYQIAKENAGWHESTKNLANPGTPASNAAAGTTIANQGDPTWYYMSVDASLPVGTPSAAGTTSPYPVDTTSTKWFSQQVGLGGAGSTPEGSLGLGGLFNQIDLVDQNPATNDYSTVTNLYANLDPVASATWATGGAAPTQQDLTFTIPAAMIQSWINNPGDNAGLLARIEAGAGQSRLYSSEGAAALRPSLVFDYQLVPEPATIGLLGLGLAALAFRRR